MPDARPVCIGRDGAARRAGADPVVWAAVHDLHGSRDKVIVDTVLARVDGYIVGIDSFGFRMSGGHHIAWSEAECVTPLGQEGQHR